MLNYVNVVITRYKLVRKKIFLLLILITLKTFAQKTSIDFDFYTHDFGTIKEDGGKVSYDFRFTNAGNLPLKITGVQAACGCTVVDWPKSTFAPGEKGHLIVTFDPENKPGPFNKSITVSTNTQQETVLLYLTGKVTPKPKKTSDLYPDAMGNLRMVSRYMNMGDITTKAPEKKQYILFNHADTAITINDAIYNKEFLEVSVEPTTLPAKQKATVFITYYADKRNDYGSVTDKIELHTTDTKMPIKTLYTVVNITKHFDTYTVEQAKNAPKFSIDKYSYDFGLSKQGDKLKVMFTITNQGNEKLEIYKVKPACGCTLSELSKKSIAKGDTARLTLIFDTTGKEGVQEKHINLYTNDPQSHNPVITLKTKIQKPQ